MVSSLTGKFPTLEDFCKACSPSAQQRYVSEPLSAFYRQTATLTDLNNAYKSKDAAASWLVPQLYNVSEFCGCKNKITNEQLADIATLLASSYPYVKVSEFLLFFAWFNDSYFWVVNRTLGVSEAKDQLTIWSITSTIAWAVGVVEVIVLSIFLH